VALPPHPTWLRSDRLMARGIARPINNFLQIEASSGVLLVGAAVAALAWANSPWSASYTELWTTEIGISVSGHSLVLDLRHWLNDGLMTMFFFVLGLEIKQEVVDGQLTSWRAAAIPATGALGGMVVPAAIYAAINAGGPGVDGWGIPMATDVAFALGVLALLGSRVPPGLKVLLLALAVVDDIGAIIVIAAFYATDLDPVWLAVAAAGVVAVVLLRQRAVWYLPVYAVLGVGVWFATHESGVHATIAGVALGLLTPSRPLMPEVDADRIADELSSDTSVNAAEVRAISFRIRESVPVTERLQTMLHPWTSYVVVPLFALANAGVEVNATTLGDAATSPVTLGVVAGLVVGKTVGVAGAIALGRRLGLGTLPLGVTGRDVVGMAGLAGIGFTVSLFVAGLAFTDQALADEAKLGILVASVVAAVLGALVLAANGRRPAPRLPDATARRSVNAP
jgi:NhaA family Na+:H+ antiporter